jgi:hypothetical protein
VLASLDEQVLEQPADGLGGEALPLVLGGDGEADLAWRGSSADVGRAVADQPVGLVSSVKPVSAIVYPLRLARLAAPTPSPSRSRSNGSGGRTSSGPSTYLGPSPEPPAQS